MAYYTRARCLLEVSEASDYEKAREDYESETAIPDEYRVVDVINVPPTGFTYRLDHLDTVLCNGVQGLIIKNLDATYHLGVTLVAEIGTYATGNLSLEDDGVCNVIRDTVPIDITVAPTWARIMTYACVENTTDPLDTHDFIVASMPATNDRIVTSERLVDWTWNTGGADAAATLSIQSVYYIVIDPGCWFKAPSHIVASRNMNLITDAVNTTINARISYWGT